MNNLSSYPENRTPWLQSKHGDYIRWLREIVGKEVILSGTAAVCAVLDNRDGEWEVLLGRRSDNGKWSIPGGIRQPTETVQHAAARKLQAEAGLKADEDDMVLIAVYSDEQQVHDYPDGTVAFEKIVYATTHYSGEPTCADGDNLVLEFFPLDALPDNCSGSTKRIAADLLKYLAGGGKF